MKHCYLRSSLSILSLLFVTGVFAQPDGITITPNYVISQVETSKAYSEQSKITLIEKLSHIKYFQADFTQVVVDEEGNAISEGSGTLSISKPNLVNWQTLLPDETSIVSDGENLWFYDPFISQVSVYNLQNAIANTPILLLTNQSKAAWQSYGVIQQSADSFVIESLISDQQIKSLTLHFNGDDLAQISLLDVTGQLSHIKLANFDKTTLLDQQLFDFVVPQGVTVDDQR